MALSFNIEEGEHKYNILLQDFITLSKSTSHPWLDIRLKSDDRTITLRFDSTNLDLLRFFTNHWIHSWDHTWDVRQYPTTDGDANSYWEFLKSSPIGLHRFRCFTRVKRFGLGYFPLRKSIHNLADIADISNQDPEQLAISMLTIIQMISNASRFRSIRNHIVQSWWNPQPLTLQMVSVLKACDMGIFTGREKEIITELPLDNRYSRKLVSIHYVLVNDIEGEGKIHSIHGFVIIEMFAYILKVYDRDSSNKECKGPGEYISLTGPCDELSGEVSFTIRVRLWNDDHEIANGEIWLGDNQFDSLLDKKIEDIVSGEHGSVVVCYSVINRGFMATIQVVVITSAEESLAIVYGRIKASYYLKSGPITRMLFDKSVEVSPQQSIPLTRPVFPVPINSTLTIAVDLWEDRWDHDLFTPEDEIARGSLQFTPIMGTQTKNITSRYGQVQVFVTCQ